MANELKTRIVLEGEKEYARAMSDAARQMKALNAEEKLAQAQFRATGNAEAHAAEQSRILREQIALQQQAVAAAEKAVAALTQQGVQPNDAAMTKWRTKLANARTALVQLQARLDSVEDDLREDTRGFEDAGDAARDYGDDLRAIGGTINTQAAIDSIGKITGAIEGTLRVAARATKAVVGLATDAGKWADEVKTTADQMGVDPETLQSWQYAAMFIDTDMTDISKSWQDIGKKLLDGNNDFAVGLDNIGISTRDAAGNLRSTEAIFWDAIDYLHGIDDESVRAAKATELFGNDWRKINPLIQAGSRAFQDLAAEGREVAVVSNDNVDELGSMQDSFDGLAMRFTKLKMDTLAALAPTFQKIAEAMSTAVTALDEFIQSEQGQEALEALGGALESIINQFTEVDENGENGFQKLVNKAAEAIGGLTQGLEWISSHSGTVVTGLALIAGVLGTLHVAEGVLNFLQLLKGVNWIGGGNGGNGGGGGVLGGLFSRLFKGGQPTGTPTTAPGTGGNPVTGTGGTGLLGWSAKAFLADAFKFAATDAAVIAVASAPAILAHNADAANIEARAESTKEAAQEAAAAYGEGADEMLNAAEMAADALGIDRSRTGFGGATILGDPAAVSRTLEAFKGYAWLRDILDPATWETLQNVGTEYSSLNAMEESGLLQGIANSIIERMAAGDSFTPVQHQATQRELWDMEDWLTLAGFAQEDPEPLGEDTVAGFAQGIREKIPEAEAAAVQLSTDTLAAIQDAMDMHSPSRAMAQLGQLAGEGFAQGLLSSAAAALAAIATRIPVGGAAGAVAYAAGASFSSSFYIDKYVQNTGEDARALAARVQDVNGWTRAGFGHRV